MVPAMGMCGAPPGSSLPQSQAEVEVSPTKALPPPVCGLDPAWIPSAQPHSQRPAPGSHLSPCGCVGRHRGPICRVGAQCSWHMCGLGGLLHGTSQLGYPVGSAHTLSLCSQGHVGSGQAVCGRDRAAFRGAGKASGMGCRWLLPTRGEETPFGDVWTPHSLHP